VLLIFDNNLFEDFQIFRFNKLMICLCCRECSHKIMK